MVESFHLVFKRRLAELMKLGAVYSISKLSCPGLIWIANREPRTADSHVSFATERLSILIVSMTTGGGCE